MDKNCKNCLFRERSYNEYPCEKCRNGNNWTPSDNLLEFAIEELEKIKAEIENKQNEVIGINQKANFQNENDYGLYFGYESSIGIIDNHIAELKGEKKKECSTCKSDNSHENCLGCIEYGHWELKGENNE